MKHRERRTLSPAEGQTPAQSSTPVDLGRTIWRTGADSPTLTQECSSSASGALKRNLAITSDELNALRHSAWDGPQNRDWTSEFVHSLGWVCAVEDDRLVGFVNVAWDGGTHAFLLDTTVDREYQRRGIGRELVLEAAAIARERGVEWLHIDYEPELDGFYQSCGFRATAAGLINFTTAVVNDER